MTQLPDALLPGAGGSYRPPALTPRTEDARAVYQPRTAPRLTVRADGWVYLNAEAARLLPRGDDTADLRAPLRHTDGWHLDCRPGGLCKLLPVGQTGGVRFRALPRVRALLGAAADSRTFELIPASNQLFRLFALSANK